MIDSIFRIKDEDLKINYEPLNDLYHYHYRSDFIISFNFLAAASPEPGFSNT